MITYFLMALQGYCTVRGVVSLVPLCRPTLEGLLAVDVPISALELPFVLFSILTPVQGTHALRQNPLEQGDR